MDSAKSSIRWGWQHSAVAGLGLLTLILLLFANKTVLQNKKTQPTENAAEQKPATSTDDGSDPDISLFGMLPALKDEGKSQGLIDSLKTVANDSARIPLLKSLVEELQLHGRLDLASLYADRLAQIQPSLKNLIVAGGLLRNASLLPPVSDDSVMAGKWNAKAIAVLEKAVALDSSSEDAMIELGIAYVQSRQGDSPMKGIETLKKVLEINPNNQEASFHLGVFSTQTGQWEKAEARFRAVKKGHPKYLLARFWLASVLEESGKIADSRKILQELASQKENSEIAAQASLKLNNN